VQAASVAAVAAVVVVVAAALAELDAPVVLVDDLLLVAVLDPPSLAQPVDIVYAYAGADSRLLDASRNAGKGIVIAAMGRGNVPPSMVEGIGRWVEEQKPVVITSRSGRGRVGCTYGYPGGGRRLAERGAIFAGARRPQQARIDVMLALGAGLTIAELRDLLEGEGA